MANYYNINRSIEAYEFRMIDPDDGQLKKLTDIPSLGGGGGGEWTGYTNLEIDTLLSAKANNADVYTQSQIDTSLGLKANLANPVFTANVTVSSILNATGVNTAGLTSNAVNTNQYYSSNLTADTTWTHNATEYMRYDYTNSTLEMKQELHIENGFKTDTIDSLTNTNLSLSRNGSEYIQFQASPERIIMNKILQPNNGRGKSQIFEGVEGALNVLRVRNLDETNPYIILDCITGTASSAITMSPASVGISSQLNCNIYNSSGDNDVSFRRLGVEYFKLDSANSVVNVTNSIGVSTSNVYADNIWNRSLATDTVYYGAHSNGTSPSVEYMRYDHLNSVLNIASGIAFSGGLNSDIVNTANNTTMSIQRNSVDYIRLTTDDRIKLDKQTDINNDGVGLTISDSVDGMIQLGNGNQIDSFFVGGAVREMYLNYFADGGVRIGNTAGYLAVNGARNGTDILTVNGSSFLNGDITCTGNIKIDNQDRITFGDRHYVREETDGTKKRLKFHAGGNDDYFRFILGNELISDSEVLRIERGSMLFRGDMILQKPYGAVKSNAFDSYDTESVIFSRNGVEQMRFDDTSGHIHIPRWLYFTGGDGTSRIYEGIENTSNILRIWNDATVNSPITILGAGADANVLLVYPTLIEARQPIRCNTYNTNGDFNMLLQQNGSTFVFYDKDDVNYPSGIFKFDCDVSVNVINFFQCQTLRAHIFDSHNTLEPDDISWRYNGSTYMFYDNSLTRFQFNVDITSGYNITCVALTETSDERLKEDIDVVHSDCSEIVKKVKVKKYYMKNDGVENPLGQRPIKKKRQNIGFVAQDVKEAIPEEFENVVNEDNEYMSINYGRMCAILWKSHQEMMNKMEKMEEEIQQLKKPKTRAKATVQT